MKQNEDNSLKIIHKNLEAIINSHDSLYFLEFGDEKLLWELQSRLATYFSKMDWVENVKEYYDEITTLKENFNSFYYNLIIHEYLEKI